MRHTQWSNFISMKGRNYSNSYRSSHSAEIQAFETGDFMPLNKSELSLEIE